MAQYQIRFAFNVTVMKTEKSMTAKMDRSCFDKNHSSSLQGDVLNLRGQRSHSGNGRYFGVKPGTNLMSFLHCGWHVTSRMHQQTFDKSGREIQLSK